MEQGFAGLGSDAGHRQRHDPHALLYAGGGHGIPGKGEVVDAPAAICSTLVRCARPVQRRFGSRYRALVCAWFEDDAESSGAGFRLPLGRDT